MILGESALTELRTPGRGRALSVKSEPTRAETILSIPKSPQPFSISIQYFSNAAANKVQVSDSTLTLAVTVSGGGRG